MKSGVCIEEIVIIVDFIFMSRSLDMGLYIEG